MPSDDLTKPDNHCYISIILPNVSFSTCQPPLLARCQQLLLLQRLLPPQSHARRPRQEATVNHSRLLQRLLRQHQQLLQHKQPQKNQRLSQVYSVHTYATGIFFSFSEVVSKSKLTKLPYKVLFNFRIASFRSATDRPYKTREHSGLRPSHTDRPRYNKRFRFSVNAYVVYGGAGLTSPLGNLSLPQHGELTSSFQ